MLPTLQVLAQHGDLRYGACATAVADLIGLTAEERKEMLPSGKQSFIFNRVGWAGWYMKQAGLVSKPKRGYFGITDEGRALLAQNPQRVDNKLLAKYPSFVERIGKQREQSGGPGEVDVDPQEDQPAFSQTPNERIEAAFQELRQTLLSELLEQLHTVDPFRFEQIVLDLLVAMGYGGSRKEAAEVTRKTGDEGIDGVINEDRLGLDVIYVQAKRWKSRVGRTEIQSFVGALAGKKANKGIFITTSDFNSNAYEYAASLHQKVILLDGQRLAELMIDHDIGVAEEQVYRVKRLDSDYFDTDAI